MLRVFHLDVAKVDLDVVNVAMAIHAYFNHMFQVFHLFSVLCCKCLNGVFQKYIWVAHVTMALVASGQRPDVATCCS
jgi:hypothetical protein